MALQTSTDKVNQAAIQDMIRKQKSGYYSAPVYTHDQQHRSPVQLQRLRDLHGQRRQQQHGREFAFHFGRDFECLGQ